MKQRGPKREYVNAVRVGEYGDTSWHVELRCGHTFQTGRKPKENQKFCCRSCISRPAAIALTDDVMDHMLELKIKSNIAAQLGIPMDQVDLLGMNGATVFIDAEQLARFR